MEDQAKNDSKTEKKFVAILDCEDHPKWWDHEQLWRKTFEAEGRWNTKMYRVPRGEFPTDDEKAKLTAVIVTGSRHCVYGSFIQEISSHIVHR